MTQHFAVAALAAILSAGMASAQTPPAAKTAPDGTPRFFAEACRDRPARAAGEIAFLEAKLNLTAEQKPLFERWKKASLSAAKATDCTPPPDGQPNMIDGLKREEKMLRARLDQLKAEMPALEALFASLSEEQQRAFRPPHGGPHPEGERRGGPHESHENGAPPPPPEH